MSVEGALIRESEDVSVDIGRLEWSPLWRPNVCRRTGFIHFEAEVQDLGSISHVRVNIHPDGGLSRVRLFGRPDAA